jgi:lysophospholipase L1-like esterase
MAFLGPDHPAIAHRGWCDRRNPSSTRLVWAGTGFALRFSGTSSQVHLEGRGMLEILLDGLPVALLGPDMPTAPFRVLAAEVRGEHLLEIRKRTEPVAGTVSFRGIDLDGTALEPMSERVPSLLFLGDSLTCGYGVLAPDGTDGFEAETEDIFRSYAGVAARELGASFQACAWSGKGMVENFDRTTSETIPALWRRSDPSDPSSVLETPPPPDLVLVNLGTNDVFHRDPDWDVFLERALALAKDLRNAFPGVAILWLDGPALTDEALRDAQGRARPLLTRIRSALDAIAERTTSEGPSLRFSLPSCESTEPHGADRHPGLERHRLAGMELAAFVRREATRGFLPRFG